VVLVKYMMMMAATRARWESMSTWSPEDVKAHIDYQTEFVAELRDTGELVAEEGLAPPSEARVVQAHLPGAPVVTDGPFPESKEFLAGYWLIECDTFERAVELAAHASAAPGPGGRPMQIPIELRPIGTEPEV
jgi:hypothetical protein